jgi:predicted RNA-binding protein
MPRKNVRFQQKVLLLFIYKFFAALVLFIGLFLIIFNSFSDRVCAAIEPFDQGIVGEFTTTMVSFHKKNNEFPELSDGVDEAINYIYQSLGKSHNINSDQVKKDYNYEIVIATKNSQIVRFRPNSQSVNLSEPISVNKVNLRDLVGIVRFKESNKSYIKAVCQLPEDIRQGDLEKIVTDEKKIECPNRSKLLKCNKQS